MRNQPRPIPRRNLPSLRKHGLSAGLFLAIIVLVIFGWVQHVKRQTPLSAPTVDVKLARIIPPKTVENPTLPDLLANDVPKHVNPTQTIDLIGAPDTSNSTGPRPPGAAAQDSPSGSGPKTILINGQPVDGGARPLIPAPIQGLTRINAYGPIPTIDSTGRSALRAYAKPFTATQGKRQISIVVGGLGLNSDLTRRAINELPAQVTLSFAAQAPGLQNWINSARARGHEVMIELPMEGGGPEPEDPGYNYTLSTRNQDSANIRNLDYLLSRATGYFAVTNYGGDILTQDAARMRTILDYFKTAGLGFVYDGASPDIVIKRAASGSKLITADMFLDTNSQNANAVMAQINALERTGNGSPIGMGFSFPGTLDGIKMWMAQKPGAVELAPVSYALSRP